MTTKRPRTRLSIDLSADARRRIRIAAARRDQSIRDYVLTAVEERLNQDLGRQGTDDLVALTARADPVLADLWDNARDDAYDEL